MGIFNPLILGVGAGVEVEAHPLFFLTAPHVKVRKSLKLGRSSGWRTSLEGGLWVPYTVFTKAPPLGLGGYFIPTCAVAAAEPDRAHRCQRPEWIVVPQAGFAASHGTTHVWTLRGDVSAGVVLSGQRPRPLDTLAPLDLQMAPIFNRWRAHGVVRYDHSLQEGIRGHVEGHFYGRGQPEGGELSPWAGAIHTGLVFGLGDSLALALGLYYWNTDQGAIEIDPGSGGGASLNRRRSHDFFPTFDLIWSGQGAL
jgi:hypothetical protein